MARPTRLDHATLRTLDLDAHRRFFEAVFDLQDGFRPTFIFLGHRLYAGTESGANRHAYERRVFLHAPGEALVEAAFRERMPTARTQEVCS